MNQNRRGFLAAAAGLLAASRARARGHITRARVSVITDEVGATQSDAVDFAKQLNIGLVELRNVPETKKEFARLSEPELRRYAAELAENKIKVSLLKTSLLKAAWPDASRRRDDLMTAIAAGKILGADRIRIFTGPRGESGRSGMDLAPVAAAIEELIPLAQAAKMRLVVENEPSQNVATGAELKGLMALIASPVAGFVWDPWNAQMQGETGGYAQLPHNRMLGIQVKGDSLEGPKALDWPEVLDRAEKDNFSGPIALATERFDGSYLKQAADLTGDLLHVVSRLD